MDMDVNIKVEPRSDDEAESIASENEDDTKQEGKMGTFTFVSVKQEAVSNSSVTCY